MLNLLGLAFLFFPPSQEGHTKAEDRPSYAFTFEQGWRLGVRFGTPDTIVTRTELVAGLGEPRLLNPSANAQEAFQRAMADAGFPVRHEPIKGKGRITLVDRRHRIDFESVEYWDSSQHWSVRFVDGKVEVRNLIRDRWSGTREEWLGRLDEIERLVLAHYVKCGAPTGTVRLEERIGFRPDDDPGRRLFVLAAMEEQLAALLLLRLQGSIVEEGWTPEIGARYPERVVVMARQIVARLTAHVRADSAPSRQSPWKFGNPAVPTFPWALDDQWMKARDQRIRDARQRLESAIRQSQRAAIRVEDWTSLQDAELREINAVDGAVPELVRDATPADVLAPRMLWPGKATFDCQEKRVSTKGALVSSRLDVSGRVTGQIVAFYDCIRHRWRVGDVTYDTWFRSTVTR